MRRLPTQNGLLTGDAPTVVAEIGGFLGPFVIGYLVDLSGTFASGGVFLCSLGIAIFICMSLLQAKP